MEKICFSRGRWSPATQAAYAVAWADWAKWCGENDASALPGDPADIAVFLTQRAATHAIATVDGRKAAILAIHALYGHEIKVRGSVIADAVAEYHRLYGTAKIPKAALTVEDVKRIVRGIPDNHLQPRAVILFAIASLMRRSEIVALNHEDLTFTDTDLTVIVRRSKTDKDGKGMRKAILRSSTEFCPVAALERWLSHADITSGPIFRVGANRMHPRLVATWGKQWAANVGFDPRVIGAHSFRRGGITTMFRNGAKIEDIMRASGHKSIGIALGYVEAERAALNPAIRALGL